MTKPSTNRNPAAAKPMFKVDADEKQHNFKYRLLEDAEDEYGRHICTVTTLDGDEFWIVFTDPEDYLRTVRHLRFDSHEDAAMYFWQVLEKVKEITTSQPLPRDIVRYLEDKARNLREREQTLLSEFWGIRTERWQLKRFADRNQLESVFHATEDSDNEAAVRSLLEFEVCVGGETVPLVSEAALYELIGKEDARTALALIGKLCDALAPNLSGR